MKRTMKKVVKDHKLDDASMFTNFYRKVNPQKLQEIMDSRKVQEDHNATANLSPKGFIRIFDPNKYMESLTRDDERYDIG